MATTTRGEYKDEEEEEEDECNRMHNRSRFVRDKEIRYVKSHNSERGRERDRGPVSRRSSNGSRVKKSVHTTEEPVVHRADVNSGERRKATTTTSRLTSL